MNLHIFSRETIKFQFKQKQRSCFTLFRKFNLQNYLLLTHELIEIIHLRIHQSNYSKSTKHEYSSRNMETDQLVRE